MKQTAIRIFILAAVTALALPFVHAQGLVWESTTVISVMGLDTTHSSFAYMPGVLKEHSTDRNSTTVIRMDKQLIISMNDKDKTYTEMTFAELESSMKQVGEMLGEKMKEMQEAMKDMPEDQRKMVEQMMGGKLPGTSKEGKIKTTKGSTKIISGFSCTEYKVTQDDKDFMTVWTTKDIQGYDSMKKDLQEFSGKLAALIPVQGKSIAEGMKKVDGFPIQTEVDGKMKMTVTKVEQRSMPDKDFFVPQGYTKIEKNEAE